MGFEGAQVVVELLARDPEARGERRGRGRAGQLGEEPAPDGVEGDRRGGRIVDDVDVEHGTSLALTNFLVNRISGL